MDELDEDNIFVAAGKKDISWMAELGCATLGIKLSSATHVQLSYLFLLCLGTICKKRRICIIDIKFFINSHQA